MRCWLWRVRQIGRWGQAGGQAAYHPVCVPGGALLAGTRVHQARHFCRAHRRDGCGHRVRPPCSNVHTLHDLTQQPLTYLVSCALSVVCMLLLQPQALAH